MPEDNLRVHESSCILRSLGYVDNEELLPDPPDDEAHTLVKLGNVEIEQIINNASRVDPLFKKGAGSVSHQPLSLSRLQLVYTADERRALHDAVVAVVPSCHDLGDLALASSTADAQKGGTVKSRVEILAELRNMKRRRAKYRVAAKTRNYSDVLRDVIKTQMETYTEAVTSTKVEENTKCNQGHNSDYDNNKSRSNSENNKSMNDAKSRDRSDERPDEKRQYGERRYREEIGRVSSRRFEDRGRSDRKRYESHRQESYKDDGKTTKESKSGRGHSDRHEGHSSYRRHHDRLSDRTRSVEENNGLRYSSDKVKDRRKTRGYEESIEKNSKSKLKPYIYKEDKFDIEKIKLEPDDHGTARCNDSHRRERERSSRERYGSRKRKRDDCHRRHGHKDDTPYKRYYEIKKEPI
ncbi:uncharacterized protein LOC128683721 isoform X2 [Plodia interpunctella]